MNNQLIWNCLAVAAVFVRISAACDRPDLLILG